METVIGDVRMEVVRRPFTARVSPPGSKSLTNRALVLASMGRGVCRVRNCLAADDSAVMIDSLRRLGHAVDVADDAVTVAGSGGAVPAASAELFCGNSGTTLRFLAAAVARGRGRYVLDGVARMRQRPVGELVGLLRGLGVRAAGAEGYPPVTIDADGLPGGTIVAGEAMSSQYLSAVLMVAPYARHEVRVKLEGRQTSWPYVAMTLRVMTEFGVMSELERDPDTAEPRLIVVPRGEYDAGEYSVEPDASNASYFLAAAAINAGSSVTIVGLGRDSLQGDVRVAELLGQMGADVRVGRHDMTVTGTDRLEGIDADLSDVPDVAQTLAVAAAFAEGPSRFTGLRTLRVKETDRVAAVQTELQKLGVGVEVGEDDGDVWMEIRPPPPAGGLHGAEIATYDDHRMAMSFAVAGTRVEGVVIKDAQCVAKTYPGFFADFRRAISGGDGEA